jgi:hypothetical protein
MRALLIINAFICNPNPDALFSLSEPTLISTWALLSLELGTTIRGRDLREPTRPVLMIEAEYISVTFVGYSSLDNDRALTGR